MKINKIFNYIIIFLILVQFGFPFSVELIKSDPSPIVAGDYADITIRFTNIDKNNDAKEDVFFGIEKNDYFSLVSNEGNIIKKIYGGESITRTFRIYFSAELEQGYIDVPFIINYNDISTKKNIRVYVEEVQREAEIYVGQIITTPNEILEDTDNNKLIINLQNLGERDVELVKAVLVPKSDKIKASYSYSLEDSISSIKSGEEAELEFKIDVEKKVESEVGMELHLRYRTQKAIGSNYDTIEKILNITLPIMPAPFVVVESVEQLDSFKIGSTENRLKITLRNDGQEDAKEVRVRIVPDISYPFLFEETTRYVSASIKPGEVASIIYKAEVLKSGDERSYESKILIESLVEESRYTREDIVSISVMEGKKTNINNVGLLVIGGIILISIGLGINTLRNRKKKEKK